MENPNPGYPHPLHLHARMISSTVSVLQHYMYMLYKQWAKGTYLLDHWWSTYNSLCKMNVSRRKNVLSEWDRVNLEIIFTNSPVLNLCSNNSCIAQKWHHTCNKFGRCDVNWNIWLQRQRFGYWCKQRTYLDWEMRDTKQLTLADCK